MKRYIINGDPIAWKRPSNNMSGKRFDPQKNLKLIVGIGLHSQQEGPPLEGALEIVVTFYFKPPKLRKRKYHCVKPDIDNMCKFLFDACKSIVFVDDAQIASLIAQKMYDTTPRVEFTIRELV